jgi:hypothetical protein
MTNELVRQRLYPHTNSYGRKIYGNGWMIFILTIFLEKNILQKAEFPYYLRFFSPILEGRSIL